jgi:hypothetical protein
MNNKSPSLIFLFDYLAFIYILLTYQRALSYPSRHYFGDDMINQQSAIDSPIPHISGGVFYGHGKAYIIVKYIK